MLKYHDKCICKKQWSPSSGCRQKLDINKKFKIGKKREYRCQLERKLICEKMHLMHDVHYNKKEIVDINKKLVLSNVYN